MKSNVITFKKGQNKANEILNETEKVAVYNGLTQKEALRLRLLTEEMSGIMSELVNDFDGEFWLECENKTFTVNLSVMADSVDDETKKKFMEMSTSGKNELAKGFMGKLRSMVAFFASSADGSVGDLCGYYVNNMDVITMHNTGEYSLWSLEKYKNDVKNKKSGEWDGLEKSIVATLADDVTVGVMGRKIKLAVKKTF